MAPKKQQATTPSVRQIPPASPGPSSHPVRRLPSRQLNPAGFDDAYASFILYCNPDVPITTDTRDLKRLFRCPPKSDGKTFDSLVLFRLVERLQSKDIKTWAELVTELGVNPPDVNKGQSAQKIQQYAVRLKRWMHAMHVDAFFEYMLGKEHSYWTDIPEDSGSERTDRDGVSPEDDLALRALLPETRPKRGRKRANDKDPIDDSVSIRRPRLHSPEDRAESDSTSGVVQTRSGRSKNTHPESRSRSSERSRGEVVFKPLGEGSPDDESEANEFAAILGGKLLGTMQYQPKPRRRTDQAVSSAWLNQPAPDGKRNRGRPPSKQLEPKVPAHRPTASAEVVQDKVDVSQNITRESSMMSNYDECNSSRSYHDLSGPSLPVSRTTPSQPESTRISSYVPPSTALPSTRIPASSNPQSQQAPNSQLQQLKSSFFSNMYKPLTFSDWIRKQQEAGLYNPRDSPDQRIQKWAFEQSHFMTKIAEENSARLAQYNLSYSPSAAAHHSGHQYSAETTNAALASFDASGGSPIFTLVAQQESEIARLKQQLAEKEAFHYQTKEVRRELLHSVNSDLPLPPPEVEERGKRSETAAGKILVDADERRVLIHTLREVTKINTQMGEQLQKVTEDIRWMRAELEDL